MKYYAHTIEGKGPEDWQELEDHLNNVAKLAKEFCQAFSAGDWGRVAGLMHDIGKHHPEFQEKLCTNSKKYADHKGIGAKPLFELLSGQGRILAYCVAGHHGGVPDFSGSLAGKKSLGYLCSVAEKLDPDIPMPLDLVPKLESPLSLADGLESFQYSFFTRMVFSALVDADFLDTEKFLDPKKAKWREPGPSIEELSTALDENKIKMFEPKGKVNKLRMEILDHCRKNAEMEPGLFTMTVPTGGGKTVTSMAFALDHAKKYGMRRVVYVIPYTSIIEQNAQVFREGFPEGSVLEHHSNFNEEKMEREGDEAQETPEIQKHRLACENWDRPVVVTTNVQFFESLFGAGTSKCRKLHNLAGSVIILDEAQMLPVKYMKPCLRALEELARNYGASIVLCTATQPALNKHEGFEHGLVGVRELAPDPARMHKEFKRTDFTDIGPKTMDQVADMLREQNQVLCVVNSRQKAAQLFRLIEEEEGAFHLSALMCPAHRTKVLAEIGERLPLGLPCRVISTSLIECGVDVSFPMVLREATGLDSVTQAAGRCNREGQMDGLGLVLMFTFIGEEDKSSKQKAAYTKDVLRNHLADPFSPAAINRYFNLAYWLWSDKMDEKNIMRRFDSQNGEWMFQAASKDFQLIENKTLPVVVPYDQKARDLLEKLDYVEVQAPFLRQLQPYIVQIYSNHLDRLDKNSAVAEVGGVCTALIKDDLYDDKYGLLSPDDEESDPAEFVV